MKMARYTCWRNSYFNCLWRERSLSLFVWWNFDEISPWRLFWTRVHYQMVRYTMRFQWTWCCMNVVCTHMWQKCHYPAGILKDVLSIISRQLSSVGHPFTVFCSSSKGNVGSCMWIADQYLTFDKWASHSTHAFHTSHLKYSWHKYLFSCINRIT